MDVNLHTITSEWSQIADALLGHATMLPVHDITIRVADHAPSVGSKATKQYRKVLMDVLMVPQVEMPPRRSNDAVSQT
jgi:hypothetical protein